MIRDFSLNDLDIINPLEVYSGETHTKELIIQAYGTPCNYVNTLVSPQDEVIAVLGGTAILHTLTIWAYLDKNVERYPLSYHREAYKYYMGMVEQFGIVRVQSIIFRDNLSALRQHMLWGFKSEGVMRKSGPKQQDEIMLARIF